jgi:general secretion pathway protein G
MCRKRREAGFTIIELLIVVGIISILAGIAITNYFGALDRSRQKRTMGDMRTIAMAWETRYSEMRSYETAGFTFPDSSVTYDELRTALSPSYARTLPEFDAWGRPFEFAISGSNLYAIRSAGRNQAFETEEYESGATSDPDCDIVYSMGGFICYPEKYPSK